MRAPAIYHRFRPLD